MENSGLALGLFCLLALLSYWITSSIVGPLRQAVIVAHSVAEGNLQITTVATGRDEISQLLNAMRDMAEHFNNIVSSVARSSGRMTVVAHELDADSNGLSKRTAEQAAALEATATAMEQLTATVKNSADHAQQASQLAAAARTQAEQGGQVVEQAIASMDTISKGSARIADIISVIDEIAFQTNLLALNATIEAARAGESGKGFAVVANEVKELAKETAKATEDISAKIEAIQTDTTSSVDSITGILTIIDQIAHFQDTIAAAVEEQAATTSEIARSVSEASRGSQEITHNMHTVADAAQSTASGAEDSSRAASELARMATDLQNLVGAFRY